MNYIIIIICGYLFLSLIIVGLFKYLRISDKKLLTMRVNK